MKRLKRVILANNPLVFCCKQPVWRSEILCVDLEVSLRMIAYRTYIRSAGADADVSAVAAFPDPVAVLGKYKAALDIGDQLAISCLVLFLDLSDHLEELGDLYESLFSCCLGKTGIHFLPLILLAVSCDLKVVLGSVYAFKDLVPDLCMLFLVGCGLLEDLGDLYITVFLCLRSEICILVARLRFACKRFHQVIECLGSDQVFAQLCIDVCPLTCISRDEETGMVIVDDADCIGCGACSDACPVSAPKIVDGKMRKCDGCNERIKAGMIPACVRSCPTGALSFE